MKIKDGDIFDIGQTVNGCSTFIWLNNCWCYNDGSKYQYDQEELTKTVLNLSGLEDITYLGNRYNIYNNRIEIQSNFLEYINKVNHITLQITKNVERDNRIYYVYHKTTFMIYSVNLTEQSAQFICDALIKSTSDNDIHYDYYQY